MSNFASVVANLKVAPPENEIEHNRMKIQLISCFIIILVIRAYYQRPSQKAPLERDTSAFCDGDVMSLKSWGQHFDAKFLCH
jgi:hypothetical protein